MGAGGSGEWRKEVRVSVVARPSRVEEREGEEDDVCRCDCVVL